MNRHLALALLFTLFLPSFVPSNAGSAPPAVVSIIGDRLDRIYSATCRVRVGGGVGTGTIFSGGNQSYPGGYYYILTNAHVASKGQSVTCEFTSPASSGAGHFPSPRITGQCIASRLVRSGSFDAAIIRIPKSSFPFEMPVIPLAESEEATPKVQLLTCGCQAGEWPSLQEVTINENRSDELIYYRPTARPGRSGSALIDIRAVRIVGLVAWMTSGDSSSQGLAMTAHRIRDWIKSQQTVGQQYTMTVMSLPEGAVEIPVAPMPSETDVVYDEASPWTAQCPDGNCPLRPPGVGPQPGSPWQSPPPQSPDNSRPWNINPDGDDYGAPDTPHQPPEPGLNEKIDSVLEKIDGLKASVDKVPEGIKEHEKNVLKGVASAVSAANESVISKMDQRAGRMESGVKKSMEFFADAINESLAKTATKGVGLSKELIIAAGILVAMALLPLLVRVIKWAFSREKTKEVAVQNRPGRVML